MATTNFTDFSTVIEASWLNDVDATVYEALGGATTAAGARSAIGISATNTPNTPAGNIAATNVQAAINELDTEKAKVGALASSGITGAAASGANSDITSLSAITSINGGAIAGFKNIIINGGFTVNQRAYASAATLSAGSYGHDRWKAGASGGDYSFTQLASNTSITIASGKSLIQVIEDKNVQATSYTLSWEGTAQARYAVNSATPSGAYAASPITITGQTVGTTMSIEFNTGTLGKVQLEAGSIATTFEYRPYSIELVLSQRYYYRESISSGTSYFSGFGRAISTTQAYTHIQFPVPLRVAPSSLEQSGTAGDYGVGYGAGQVAVCTVVPSFISGTEYSSHTSLTVAAVLTSGGSVGCYRAANTAYLGWSSEL